MKNLNKTVLNWFQQKINETYGKPQTKIVSLPPKIEWEEIEVPYEDFENYTEQVDAGVQLWVYLTGGLAVVAGIVLLFLKLYIPGIIPIVFGAGFLYQGSEKFRKTEEKTFKKKVIKKRKEKKKKVIPQFKEEVIPGEWSIKRMGTGALQFGVAKVNEAQFLTGINFSNTIQKFKYPIIKKEKGFMESFKNMENQLENIPFVLNGEKESFEAIDLYGKRIKVLLSGIEKDIMNHFIDTAYFFVNSKNKEVPATLLKRLLLKNYLKKTGKYFELYEDEFLSIINDGYELDDACSDWLNKWPEWNKTLQDIRYDSVTEQVIPEFSKFSNLTHYSSFNFYCPDCNKEMSEELMNRNYSVHNSEDLSPQRFSKDTRCHFLLESNAWQCPMCEKITLNPIPLHKSLDEILLPVYDNLMEENKTEREKDYSDVRKKEIHYKNEMNKELEKMFFDNLNSILDLKDNMEKMHAEIDGESEAIQFINESVAKYKKLQSEIINSIEKSNEELKMRIQATAQKILADVDRIKDREMEMLNRELNDLSKAKRLEDEQRDSIQQQTLSANLKQNQILDSKFSELISTNKEGLGQVSEGISKLEETNRKGFENTVNASKDIKKAIGLNNAMQAARNEKIGINPYDHSSILRPGRSVKQSFIEIGHKITGKSSIESHESKLETLN